MQVLKLEKASSLGTSHPLQISMEAASNLVKVSSSPSPSPSSVTKVTSLFHVWSMNGSQQKACPTGDIYFHFNFFAPFPFRTAQGCPWNEIKQDRLPVVIVVLDSDTIIQGLVYIYSRIIALTYPCPRSFLGSHIPFRTSIHDRSKSWIIVKTLSSGTFLLRNGKFVIRNLKSSRFS